MNAATAATAVLTLLFGRCPCCDARIARTCTDAGPVFREPTDVAAVRHTCGSELAVEASGAIRGRVPCTVAWGGAVRSLNAEAGNLAADVLARRELVAGAVERDGGMGRAA